MRSKTPPPGKQKARQHAKSPVSPANGGDAQAKLGSRSIPVEIPSGPGLEPRTDQTEALHIAQEELKSEASDSKLLQDLSSRLIYQENIAELYEEIMEAAVAIMNSDFASMQTLYPERGENGELRLLACRGFTPEAAKFWEWVRADSNCSCGAALHTGHRIIVPDVEECEFMAGSADLAAYRQAGISSMQSTPLISRNGKMLGMISTHWRTPHQPSEHDLRVFDILTRQAADLLDRKQAEEALRQELALRKKTETLVAGEKQVLELIASGAPLRDALELLTRIIEERFSDQGALASVLLLESDGRHLRHGAAPSLPDAYNQAIDGIQIGPAVGSCGTAAFRREQVIVTDIATDPLWKDFSGLALEHGLRACWSTPLFAYGKILGTFAIYYRRPQAPAREELDVLDRVSRTAAVAVEHDFLEKERKRASETHARLAAIVSSSDDAIISKDLNGVIMTWNRGAERLFGYTPEEVIGKPVTILMPPDRVDEEPAILERIRHGESIEHYETVRRRKDGALLDISLTVSPITGADGRITGASKVARDITQRKQAEQALRQAEKLAAVGRLAATVAHEINNPLAAVTNLIWLLRHEPALPETARAYLKSADEELSRVAHLTKQTLGFYRGNSSPARFRVAELIEGLLALFAPRLRNKNLRIHSIVDPALEVTAVSGELRQILTNLTSNSIDAVANGGRIWIRAKAASMKGRKGIRVLVGDNGPGIPESHRAKIFRPFFSTKEDVGTGLGLWVVHEIVQKHHGSIRLRTSTRPGRSGTAFSIFIPEPAGAELQPMAKQDVQAAS